MQHMLCWLWTKSISEHVSHLKVSWWRYSGREFTVLFYMLHKVSLCVLKLSVFSTLCRPVFYHVSLDATFTLKHYRNSLWLPLLSLICPKPLFGVTIFWEFFSLKFLINFIIQRNISLAQGKDINFSNKHIVFSEGNIEYLKALQWG
jgi:hypothetical protein